MSGIKSIQYAAVKIPDAQSSTTVTITAVNTSNTIILFGVTPYNAGGESESASITLTNSTTITLTRSASVLLNGANFTLNVVEFLPGIISSIQYVEITYPDETATITSVNTAKSVILPYGGRGNSDLANMAVNLTQPYKFNSSTQIGFSVLMQNSRPHIVRAAVVEFL